MRLALLLLLSSACTPAAPAIDPPPCEDQILDQTLASLPSLPEGARPSALLHGVAKACNDEELAGLFDVRPSGRAAAVTLYVREHPTWWTAGCPAGAAPLADLAPLPAAERTAKLHGLCKLDRFGWSLPRTRIMGERVPVGIIVAGRLSTSNAERRQQVLDALAGK